MNISKNEPKKERSALYPYFTLANCIGFIELIDKHGGKEVSESTLLDTLKLANRQTRTYTGKISSSKQFGLVTTKGSLVGITDAGRRLLYPTEGETERRNLIGKAFSSPSLYKRLVERFGGKALPPEDLLGNVLMNEYGISKAAKDRAAKVFVRSAKYAGLLSEDNVLRVSGEVEPRREKAKEAEEARVVKGGEDVLSSSTAGIQSVKVTLSGGATGTITVPNTITKKDVERLKKMLDLLLIEEE